MYIVGQEEIDAIVASGEPSPRLVIRSPRTGHIVDKKIVVGASVEAKMTLFEVADLTTVWIEAEVFENDIPFLQAGQEVEATVEAYPNRKFKGKLALVHPHLEIATRTNRIRFKLDNPEHELRPGMFASVLIDTPLESIEPYRTLAAKSARITPASRGLSQSSSDENGTVPLPVAKYEFLVVPQQAVVDTGARKVVYVQREAGVFEGREVQLGPRQDDFYPVLTGLKAGEQVAAAGSFLIDAETRLNPAAASTYFGASGGPQTGSSSPAPAVQQKQAAPAETKSPVTEAPSADDMKNIEQLPDGDRQAATKQRSCPVTDAALGSMGVPIKIALRGQTVFLCCKSCIGKAKRDPDGVLKKLAEMMK